MSKQTRAQLLFHIFKYLYLSMKRNDGKEEMVNEYIKLSWVIGWVLACVVLCLCVVFVLYVWLCGEVLCWCAYLSCVFNNKRKTQRNVWFIFYFKYVFTFLPPCHATFSCYLIYSLTISSFHTLKPTQSLTAHTTQYTTPSSPITLLLIFDRWERLLEKRRLELSCSK